jgi:hypothetical protein
MDYKRVWRRNEDPLMIKWNAFCDKLHNLIPKLTADFMQNHQSIIERLAVDGQNAASSGSDKVQSSSQYQDNNAWQAVLLKYTNEYADIKSIPPDIDKKFPTAYQLLEEFGENCPIALYSCLAPQTAIQRHTGPENIEGKYIRVHVPLIVPKGELFLEVNGDFVTWDDIFCFDNQFVHSAHNYSDEWRLIFFVDFDRESIGIPPGLPYDENRSGDTNIRFGKNRQQLN